MNFRDFSEKMKSIQSILLEFIEDKSESEERYENLINCFIVQRINNDHYEFKGFLQLINHIFDNHKRCYNFISKIEMLLRYFKKDIQKYFTNSEIFNIFKNNKRILLFLIEEKIMTIDEYIFSQIASDEFNDQKYFEYFLPEIKPFLTKENIEKYGFKSQSLRNNGFVNEVIKKEIDEDFYEKRRKGENDGYLCELIRSDKIKEFITFVNQTNLSLESYIKESIFETNQFLIDEFNTKLNENKGINLIEYASFYGSFKIMQFLIKKTEKIDPKLWIYAVHGNNVKMIHFLEEHQIEYDSKIILKETIKCHHNAISNYIICNLFKEEDLQNDIENNYYDNLYQYALEYGNYYFFPENTLKCKNLFFYSCQFGYSVLVRDFLKEGNIDINATIKIINILNII